MLPATGMVPTTRSALASRMDMPIRSASVSLLAARYASMSRSVLSCSTVTLRLARAVTRPVMGRDLPLSRDICAKPVKNQHRGAPRRGRRYMHKMLTLTQRIRRSRPQKGGRTVSTVKSLSRGKSITTVAVAGALGVALIGALGMREAPVAAGSSCQPTVTKQFIGKAFDLYAGRKLNVFRYTLRNCRHMTVQILTYGAITQSITVPDKHGKLANVLLGFKTLNDYISKASPPPPNPGGPYFGEIVGRYGNRIAGGTFNLDGHTYTLPINNGPNSLHGGFVGFGNHVWSSVPVVVTGQAGVALTIVSPNGDGGKNVGCVVNGAPCTGYPGRLTLHVTYLLDNNNRLWIHYDATVAGKATVLNPTNHAYFNMAGESSGDTYGQEVKINADRYTPTDSTQIPTGVEAPVAGTPFDFRTFHTLGSRINTNDPQ